MTNKSSWLFTSLPETRSPQKREMPNSCNCVDVCFDFIALQLNAVESNSIEQCKDIQMENRVFQETTVTPPAPEFHRPSSSRFSTIHEMPNIVMRKIVLRNQLKMRRSLNRLQEVGYETKEASCGSSCNVTRRGTSIQRGSWRRRRRRRDGTSSDSLGCWNSGNGSSGSSGVRVDWDAGGDSGAAGRADRHRAGGDGLDDGARAWKGDCLALYIALVTQLGIEWRRLFLTSVAVMVWPL